MPYAEGSAELRSGDTLLVFSDGVTVRPRSPRARSSSEGRLAALVVDKRDLAAEELQAAILKELDRYSEDTRASDAHLIVLKRRLVQIEASRWTRACTSRQRAPRKREPEAPPRSGRHPPRRHA